MSKRKQGVPSVQEQITSFSGENFEKMRSDNMRAHKVKKCLVTYSKTNEC
jgi:hypothetical protein